MGCCSSIPHTKRRYRDPADLDEIYVNEDNEEIILPMREFGNYRAGLTNLVPDDIDGLPSTHLYAHLATDPDTLLYEAEIDQGRAFRCIRPWVRERMTYMLFVECILLAIILISFFLFCSLSSIYVLICGCLY